MMTNEMMEEAQKEAIEVNKIRDEISKMKASPENQKQMRERLENQEVGLPSKSAYWDWVGRSGLGELSISNPDGYYDEVVFKRLKQEKIDAIRRKITKRILGNMPIYLPASEQAAFRLFVFENRSLVDIADILRVSKQAVSSYLNRIGKKLKETFNREFKKEIEEEALKIDLG